MDVTRIPNVPIKLLIKYFGFHNNNNGNPEYWAFVDKEEETSKNALEKPVFPFLYSLPLYLITTQTGRRGILMLPKKIVAIGKFCLDLGSVFYGSQRLVFRVILRLGVSNMFLSRSQIFLCLGLEFWNPALAQSYTVLVDLPQDDRVSAEGARDAREASESERHKPPNQQKPETGFEKVSSTLPTRRRRLWRRLIQRCTMMTVSGSIKKGNMKGWSSHCLTQS